MRGIPVVIAVPPHLDDGTPFPTRYWLTCPLAVRRIGRIESGGGVKAAEARLAEDDTLAARHEATMARYAAERDALIDETSEGPRPSGGVAGAAMGVKCIEMDDEDYVASVTVAGEEPESEGES